jgi:hypothetical protein
MVFVRLLAWVGPCLDTPGPVLQLLKPEPLSAAVRCDGSR